MSFRYVFDSAVFEFLASKNIATITFDVHGHGNSEPSTPRFAIQSFSDVISDAEQHAEEVLVPFCESKCPGAPVFLMGSSMGALAVCRFSLERTPSIPMEYLKDA